MMGKKYEKPTFEELVSMVEVELRYYSHEMDCPNLVKNHSQVCSQCEFKPLCWTMLDVLIEINKAREDGLI